MYTIITSLEELTLNKTIIENIYAKYKRMPQQSYYSYYAKMKDMGEKNVIIYIDDELPCILAFERRRKDGIFQSIADLYPILGNYVSLVSIKDILRKLQNVFGIKAFYFPQIDADSQFVIDAISDQDFETWQRLDCPIYANTEYMNNGFEYPKCCKHPHRKEKKLLAHAYVKTLAASEAEEVIRFIELSSWKHTCKQDMISRNQLHYYVCLIKNNILNVTALLAKENDEPIAYRIDTVINDTVFVVKWSYNMAYAKYSPGSYLATRELFSHYASNDIAIFNLYGSPDSLKDRIENKRITRRDLVFVNGMNIPEVQKLRNERIEHDRKINEAHKNKQSLQEIYMK